MDTCEGSPSHFSVLVAGTVLEGQLHPEHLDFVRILIEHLEGQFLLLVHIKLPALGIFTKAEESGSCKNYILLKLKLDGDFFETDPSPRPYVQPYFWLYRQVLRKSPDLVMRCLRPGKASNLA